MCEFVYGCMCVVCGGVHTIPIYKPYAGGTKAPKKAPKTTKKRYGEPYIYYNMYVVLYYVYIYVPTKLGISKTTKATMVVGLLHPT